jgi:hypothetical protein
LTDGSNERSDYPTVTARSHHEKVGTHRSGDQHLARISVHHRSGHCHANRTGNRSSFVE